MDTISNYSSNLINIIIDAKEISYYELKRYFQKNKTHVDDKEIKKFNLENELDKLERMGIVKEEEGMIIFQGM
ncbi:hypothetical protein [Clostridium saccharobutylicum]|uniref:Uncharacterized protein n=1 Tax=Clostridium saccharobutylicum DSM 13864 TaxID=1345695 RepID=U5MTC1_CLOSA|nr:hypothetical protein [Clostridium saccharobutylicum]AGX44019.1 hypothetical protein CLSA_c30530 [Clostridium saccharobutylicum DSM 13864]AQR91311.1 hypothetical protein CLOSC_30360 [Clostridium saccharobutylicum]AQS01215.1 hypothetical protein CSACC_30430 [Clostridium saccharobutylicum]AQS10824.1 hypothetical protein CLOBY_29730 [Clostridium saccharobutylicum]AQS15198.1 hypothetical protein CLOSACC_30430 [Clostridium saccharobutylicum]